MGWTKPSGGYFGTGNVDADIAVQEEMMGAVYNGVLVREGWDGRGEQRVKLKTQDAFHLGRITYLSSFAAAPV